MVVATQKGRRYPTLTSSCSTDSLARSLHKEVDYSPVNVSRRSPDQNMSPVATLGPDSHYPTSGQRKRQNTILDTGWHACFKNNNYVFVRNTNDANGQFGDKWKENNDSEVTFIISTTKPIHEGKDEKLVVSLHDSKPKIRRCTPSPPPCEDLPTKKTPKTDSNRSGTLNKRSDKKRTPNWLKRLRNSGRNRPIKVDASEEETTLILGPPTDESPDSTEVTAPPKTKSPVSPPPTKPTDIISPKSQKEPTIQSPSNCETPILGSTQDLVHGPQTSTPKDKSDVDRIIRNGPRKSGTPYRPLNSRLSIRKRLPIDDITPDTKSNPSPSVIVISPQHDLLTGTVECKRTSPGLEIPISPIKKRADYSTSKGNIVASEETPNRLQRRASCYHSGTMSIDKENDKSNGALQRRASCVQTIKVPGNFSEPKPKHQIQISASPEKSPTDVPKSGNRLHPSSSNTDIPFADSESDVSFDDRRGRRLIKQREAMAKAAKSTADVSFEVKDASALKTKSVPHLTPANQIAVSETKPSSRSEPSIVAKVSCNKKEMFLSPMEVEENVSLTRQAKRLEDSFDSIIKTPMSPMEEEENMSLNQPVKHLFTPDDSTVTFSPYTPIKRPCVESAISYWLKQIRFLTDSECLNALQAKELLKEDWIPNALAVGNAQETSEKIWEVGNAIQQHMEDMMECLKSDKPVTVPLSLKVAQFCSSVVELLKMSNSVKQISQAEARIRKACSELLDTVNKGDNGKDWKNKVKAELECLQKVAQVLVQQLLLSELHVIINCVERAENINNLKRSVFAVILLGRIDPTFCELMTKLGAVRSLLSICVEKKWREMHPCGLRALTVLSCVPSAIRSFEECGGVDCVCDILCEEDSQEGSRSEAAGLVAQITAPWTEGSGYVLQSVNNNSDRLVRSLANLASTTDNSEVFLLSSAALANLSFADAALKKMKEYKVLEILVTACRSKTHATSLFIKDQVATVLANMAAKEEYRDGLSSGGSLVLLLCFLQLRPSSVHGTPQLAACERIQQKAAIALARLCTKPETSNIVAEMQGIQRLVKLCKDRKERNDSDSVLVACLAALRKIAAVREKDEFLKLGAQELVEPRLWDAFLAHSSKRESYV
ncbi:protein inscuteable homolog [Trichonephila inaurata madagascariensis]|uniref:Protein inscuteable homolog n=1 Tax=Trichonephila inaurata madagascariensis TaxID=2747483 RepID=A0A8X6XUG0_9ARAC|nr:protein inscuteable homolog [Trichonephila inaurata madagascariensis]